jgi:hypothetical protein
LKGDNKIAICAKPDVDSEKVGSIDAGTSFNVVEQNTCADGRIICDSKMANIGLMTEKNMLPTKLLQVKSNIRMHNLQVLRRFQLYCGHRSVAGHDCSERNADCKIAEAGLSDTWKLDFQTPGLLDIGFLDS